MKVRRLDGRDLRGLAMNAIDWVLLGNDAVKAGDLVSADAGGMPIYRVVSVEGAQAWLEGDRAVRKMPLSRFRWKAGAGARLPDIR